MSAIFEWATPPAKNRIVPGRKSQFADALDELRKYPGQWARISATPLEGGKAVSHAARIRNGGISDSLPGEFDASDNEGHVYAKFDGPEGVAKRAAMSAERAERKAAKAARRAAAEAEGKPVDPADADDESDEDPALFDEDNTDDAPAAAGAWG